MEEERCQENEEKSGYSLGSGEIKQGVQESRDGHDGGFLFLRRINRMCESQELSLGWLTARPCHTLRVQG